MCGIAGWLGALPDNESIAGRMVQALRHRGPDGHGIQSWPEATLVHTRLSIIDLSPLGAQPMSNEDGTVWTVFNGELYNHRELRRQLEAQGHRFRGHADTEVLPHLYEEEGAQFVTKLRGMFALAIYDTRSKTLLLARDRFGIKPLFYAPGRRRFAFASELNALREVPDINLQVNRQAIYDFAALSFIPAPETFYTGIQAVRPAELVEAHFVGHDIVWRAHIYHRWSIQPNPCLTLETATDQADQLVAAAVQRQLESDVPLGTLLSGGIDSSLVSAGAQDVLKDKLQSFNVRFAEHEYDETWAAAEVAKHIGSRHLTLDMEDVPGSWNHITELLLQVGQPFADTSLFAVHRVCRVMRQYVTVALSGDGGDEGFGGYDIYWRLARLVRLHRLPVQAWHAAAAVLPLLIRGGMVPARMSQRLHALSNADDISVIQNILCPMTEKELGQFCRGQEFLPVRRWFEPQWEHHFPSKASRLERLSGYATEAYARLILPNGFLFKVDTASMKESLEVRVPMLDEELFAFGLSLPHHLKVQGRMCKRVLRAVADRRLPSAIATKPKRGFLVPINQWIDKEFKSRLRDTLLGPSSQLSEFFQPELYQPMVKAFCQGQPYVNIRQEDLYKRIIILLSVQLTLDGGSH